MTTILTEQEIVLASMWRTFTNHMRRSVPSEGFSQVTASLLLESLAPIAWKISVEARHSPINPGLPGDRDKQWEALIRHIMAKAKSNKGFARASIDILCHDARPLLWEEVGVRLIYPMSLANDLGREIISSLLIPSYTRP